MPSGTTPTPTPSPNLDDMDYMKSACLDTAFEELDGKAVCCACSVAETAEQFFWAIQASIRLKEITNA